MKNLFAKRFVGLDSRYLAKSKKCGDCFIESSMDRLKAIDPYLDFCRDGDLLFEDTKRIYEVKTKKEW